MSERKFVVSKTVTIGDASVLLDYIDRGFTIIRATGPSNSPARAESPNGTSAKATGPRNGAAKARRRKRKTPKPATPEMIADMTALRKQGKVWRIIGKRYGLSPTRAWQIVNKGR